ncbi:MAG: tetratricopeptide repeat protein [Martelella sp.]|uniref:tetratricopeptide repeat protein n=1 Tax=Martelella sp. TaxID=1969699 RepID=UPI003242EABA
MEAIRNRTAVIVATALSLAGCASVGANTPAINQMSGEQRALYQLNVERNYYRDTTGITTALPYADYLEAIGEGDRAESIMASVATSHKSNPQIQVRYAEILLQNGNAPKALDVLTQVERSQPTDWRFYDVKGQALDLSGDHTKAKAAFGQALKLSPDNPAVLTDLATSYVLSHNLPEAEALLKRAVTQRGASPEVRQNLALVVALQGRKAEAREIAASDVSRQQSRLNLKALADAQRPGSAWASYAM